MKISETIAGEARLDQEKWATFKKSIRQYIDRSAQGRNDILAGRSDSTISPVQLKRFFRNREREENTCHLIQYLLTFAEKVPGDPPPSKDPAAPEEQLHEFVRYQVDLLLEKDVKKAILREYSQLGILKSGNFWYYEGRITDLHKELDAAMNSCPRQGPAAINQLCRVLERLSLFWFDLCREDVRRVRTSDILIYKLTLILRNSGGRFLAARDMIKIAARQSLPPGYRLVPVRTTYLEMKGKPESEPIALPEGCVVERWEKPGTPEYRELFTAVGGAWGWSGRLLMKENELETILHARTAEVYRLFCNGQVAGFAELERGGHRSGRDRLLRAAAGLHRPRPGKVSAGLDHPQRVGREYGARLAAHLPVRPSRRPGRVSQGRLQRL